MLVTDRRGARFVGLPITMGTSGRRSPIPLSGDGEHSPTSAGLTSVCTTISGCGELLPEEISGVFRGGSVLARVALVLAKRAWRGD